jgi:hypothetical protein
VLDGDLVAKEPCRLCAGVGDQGLVGRQFELEVVAQELGQPCLDLLGLGIGSDVPEQGAVRVEGVP